MIQSKQIQKPQKILVVDDQELNRDILGAILEDRYEVIYAADGVEALDGIREHVDSLSLVMLDLFMPNMDGFEVLKRMKEDESTKSIPVIVLTAEKSAELRALQMGAADFITKPFDLSEVILARVGRIIELSEGRKLILSAEYDRLTMLYNRNFFYEYVDRIYTYHPEIHMDAVSINIEQFHSVNALNGREFGDKILQAVGAEIRAFLAETEGIASHIDADRFAVYCTHQADYRSFLDRLQAAADEISHNVSIHLRMGVCEWGEGIEPIVMFDRARTACKKVRGNFQNPFMIYNEELRKRELLDQRLLNDLQAAIDEHQFVVYYQPKYKIQVDPPMLGSAEALIRWNHPELGMVSPGAFIPLFESNGLISKVDAFVWREVAKQVGIWKKKYQYTIPVSVNLSRADVFDETLVDRLIRLIRDNGLDYRDVKLEVTESAYTDNAKQLLDVVTKLRDTGFEIEMDDFGSGYSSLNMLSSMPIDALKMDIKFIRDLEQSETDRQLVRLILDLAKYLGVPVIAEGVETKEQLDILRAAGCDLVQGFYFSRPIPPEEFEKLIQRELETKRG